MYFLRFAFLIAFTFVIQIAGFSQSLKELDVVVLIDGRPDFQYGPIILSVESWTRRGLTIYCNYHPGNLSLPVSDYKALLNDSVKALNFIFEFDRLENGTLRHKKYSVPLGVALLRESYFVLSISTVKARRGRARRQHSTDNFTYSVDSPNGTLRFPTAR